MSATCASHQPLCPMLKDTLPMIKYTLILLFLFSLINIKIYSQESIGLETKLTLIHSLKHPIKRIEVSLIPYKDSLLVKVEASARFTNADVSKYNFEFLANLNESRKLKSNIKKVKPADLINQLDWDCSDGYTVEVTVDGLGGTLNYRIKSPTIDTKKRNLSKFVEFIRYILLLAKLNPDEVLNV